MLLLLTESMPRYDVIPCPSAEEGLVKLKDGKVDLIISDVMLTGMDGFAFTRMVKGNRHTMAIPIILISAKGTTRDKSEGFKAGCDAYLEKPFEMDYLIAVAEGIMDKGRRTKEYYDTSASAYSYVQGKLTSGEDIRLMEEIDSYIKDHILEKISVQDIADSTNMSTRSLYRRFSDMQLPTPNEYIARFKLEWAARLLRTTSLTIKEVMYESGFANKAHFHREFLKYYGVTPSVYRSMNNKADSSLE